MAEEKLMETIREAENALGLKRLERKQLPERIEQCRAEMNALSDPEAIRGKQKELRDLEREHEVQELVLKSHAVAVQEAYVAFFKERLATSRATLAIVQQEHDQKLATFKEAEKALEAAQTELMKAKHQVEDAERSLKTRQDNLSQLRSGVAIAA